MFFRGYVKTFQSTPSVWRETSRGEMYVEVDRDFNPLPPYGGRPFRHNTRRSTAHISIHSLRMEGDPSALWERCSFEISIHSLRMEGDSGTGKSTSLRNFISIHSLRMEGDFAVFTTAIFYAHFNPLPPYGGRQQNCTGKRFSFRLSLYNPAKKDAKDYILHPKK